MPSDFFLGQTAAEWHQNPPHGAKKAWMACHFSSYGTGLSNLPRQLPAGSMVIVNDRMPIAGHDPALIAGQLQELVRGGNCAGILLDFQRPGEARTAAVAKAIAEGVPCPVGVSHWYARELSGPVFLPPLPLHTPLARHIAPWQGREIWLELASDCAVCTVTQEGFHPESREAAGPFPHFSQDMYCHYRTEIFDASVVFTLHRSCDDALSLLQVPQIARCIGLFQEFSQPQAQETAFFQ